MPPTAYSATPSRVGFDRVLDTPKRIGLIATAVIIAAIAWMDANIYPRVSMGMLYTVPMVFGSLFMNRTQIGVQALALSLLREHYHPYGWDQDAFTRFFYVFISYAAAGLFSGELARNRRLVLSHFEAIRREVARREDAERQLRTLIESSPAAIVMLEPDGRVDLANEAAHRLLLLEDGSLPGRRFVDFIPMVDGLLSEQAAGKPYRTAAHCRGRRANGESFIACLWFSTFATHNGPRLAAIITDSSDDLRDLQESSLQSLLRSTRVLVGSVSHEIRNMCAAIGVVHANLGRVAGMAGNEDFQALGTLSQGLARIATLELQNTSDIEVDSVDIAELLEEFSVVQAPALELAEVGLRITVEPDLPMALGDRHGLLQVLLNLTRNSLRAMGSSGGGTIRIEAASEGDSILITHRDTGPGIRNPESLFRPFRSGENSAGLGLFVSRAIVRACGGDLTHEASSSGCRMLIRLRREAEEAMPLPAVNSELHSPKVVS